MEILSIIICFFIGIILSDIFMSIGYRLPIDESIINKKCLRCKNKFKIVDKLLIFSYIKNKGKCPYCREKEYNYYFIFSIFTGFLYAVSYIICKNQEPFLSNYLFSLIFISSLLIIIVSDFKYMLIPNEVLIVSFCLLTFLKLYNLYYNEEIMSFNDGIYSLIFLLFDFIVIYLLMLVIKKIGDLIFKRESMGKGDVKLMALISVVVGYKMSIVVVFLASFIALPFSVIKVLKNNDNMLPFGPFLAISTIILFLLNINYDMVLNFIG